MWNVYVCDAGVYTFVCISRNMFYFNHAGDPPSHHHPGLLFHQKTVDFVKTRVCGAPPLHLLVCCEADSKG